MKRVKHLLLILCLLPVAAGAQGVADATFLELTPDARSAGMAGTGLAITDNGSTAIFHNASTIAFSMESMGANYSYSDFNQDFALHSASLFYRVGREGKQGFTAGFRHYKQPESFFSDGSGNLKNFRPHAWSLDAGYFTSLNPNLALSLTLRYLQASASPYTNSKGTVCLDFGMTYHHNMPLLDEMASWTVAIQAAHIGRKLDGQKLPARLGAGGAIDLPFSMENRLQVALDVNYLLPSDYRHVEVSAGAEYKFLRYGVVRGGYHLSDKDKGLGNYGTLGCGIDFWPLRADFSYALADEDCFMHKTWQLSVGFSF